MPGGKRRSEGSPARETAQVPAPAVSLPVKAAAVTPVTTVPVAAKTATPSPLKPVAVPVKAAAAVPAVTKPTAPVKAAAAERRLGGDDPAVMEDDDFLDQRQAEPGPLPFRRKEWLEDPLPITGLNAKLLQRG